MAQQMVNNSHYDGSRTITFRQSDRYAVVNPPFSGKHLKPQDEKSLAKRKERWAIRKRAFEYSTEQIKKMLWLGGRRG